MTPIDPLPTVREPSAGVAGSAGGRHVCVTTALLCSLALLLPLAWPLIKGRVFVFDDLANFHLPVRYLYQKALVAGDSVLWTPALFAGFYLHGEGQAGMFHPLHLLLYRTLPLDVAFNLEFLSSYVIAFAGMVWWARRLAFSTGTALIAAMLFAFCGFHLLHFHHMNVTAVTAHVPWLLACIDVVLADEKPRRRAAAYGGVALVIASAVLLGFPQAVWWNLVAAGAFALWRCGENRRYRRLVPCALAIVTGVLIGGIQLLPTLDLVAHSTRAGIPRDFALTYSLHPYNAVQLWSPYALARRVYSWADYPQIHEFGIYCGTLAMIAPLWLWSRRHALGPRRSLAAAAAVFAATMFVLALGRYGYVDVLLTYLPGLGSLRAPVRYIVLVQLALTVLTAIAIEDVASLPADRRPLRGSALALICTPALLSVLTTLMFNVFRMPFVPARLVPAPWTTAATGTAIVTAVTVAFAAAVRTRSAMPVLIGLVALDLGYWGTTYVWQTRPRHVAELTAVMPPVDTGWRYDWDDQWRDRPILRGEWLAYGYAGLFPYTNLPPGSEEYLRLAGARASIRIDGAIIPVSDPSPRASVAGDRSGRAVVIVDRPGHIVIATETTVAARLALTERRHAGWTATLDTRTPLAIEALRGDFLSCDLPAGTHRVEFRFAPASFRQGVTVSAAGLAALALGVAITGRSRRRPR